MANRISDVGAQMLTAREGVRLKPYFCGHVANDKRCIEPLTLLRVACHSPHTFQRPLPTIPDVVSDCTLDILARRSYPKSYWFHRTDDPQGNVRLRAVPPFALETRDSGSCFQRALQVLNGLASSNSDFDTDGLVPNHLARGRLKLPKRHDALAAGFQFLLGGCVRSLKHLANQAIPSNRLRQSGYCARVWT